MTFEHIRSFSAPQDPAIPPHIANCMEQPVFVEAEHRTGNPQHWRASGTDETGRVFIGTGVSPKDATAKLLQILLVRSHFLSLPLITRLENMVARDHYRLETGEDAMEEVVRYLIRVVLEQDKRIKNLEELDRRPSDHARTLD